MKPIEVKHLKFSYDQEMDVVKDVSFSVERGSYTTIIGHNGSGKSTIAKLLIGLLEKEEGEILIDGAPLTLENLASIRGKIGIVFQNPDNQFIGATVRDDIAFGLENHQVESKDMDEIIERFAAEVNMTEYLNHEPTRLSGGQKQRVAIAGVLAMSPEILILDEATSMLDPQGKEDVNSLVDQLHKSRNMTILSITHDIEEVRKGNHVLVMNEGQIVMDGSPEVILHRYADLVKLRLDAPFSVKLALELKKQGVVVDTPMDEEGMVSQLCRSLSKK
ncbi:MAG: energy-coupling factor transporter ATPase [Erysipelotrichaceae bacterium]